jgi:hypothetical protein
MPRCRASEQTISNPLQSFSVMHSAAPHLHDAAVIGAVQECPASFLPYVQVLIAVRDGSYGLRCRELHCPDALLPAGQGSGRV